MQLPIPYMHFRGGSSKALFFNAADLPSNERQRNKMVLAAMEGLGLGDARQIDGLGGGTSLTSKVAVVSLSHELGIDINYLFLQVVLGKGVVSAAQTCGNILAGVVPFAIESGMLRAHSSHTVANVKMVNTGGICEVTVETPDERVNYSGNTKVDGVPGTAAPVICNYLQIQGATCGALLPTGSVVDVINGIGVTCIDNGMPSVLVRAADLGITGYETPAELDADNTLKKTLESLRLAAGPMMHLGDVLDQTVPKMCIISQPMHGGTINTRTFIPHVCHEAIGVLGATSVAAACLIAGTIAWQSCAALPVGSTVSVEHPAGEFTVMFDTAIENGTMVIKRSGLVRTARLLSRGLVYIPEGRY